MILIQNMLRSVISEVKTVTIGKLFFSTLKNVQNKASTKPNMPTNVTKIRNLKLNFFYQKPHLNFIRK